MKFVLVIERIKGFDHDLFFLWVSKQKILIQTFFWQISRIQSIATQRFFKFWQKLSTSKNISLKVSKYDTSRVKRNIAFFENILCTFYSVMVKEIIMNGQIDILTLFHWKTSHAHLQDQNLNLLMFDNYSKSEITWQGYYLTLWNLSESFQYSTFSLLPQFNLTMIEIPKFVQ